MRRDLWCTVVPLLMLAGSACGNPAENDEAMAQLASRSGCTRCHGILPAPRRADGLPPIAPAWQDIAIRYRNDPGASDRLTRTVMAGSNPLARHWAGKAGAVTMPPNATDVTEADARMLVNWILVLVP